MSIIKSWNSSEVSSKQKPCFYSARDSATKFNSFQIFIDIWNTTANTCVAYLPPSLVGKVHVKSANQNFHLKNQEKSPGLQKSKTIKAEIRIQTFLLRVNKIRRSSNLKNKYCLKSHLYLKH